MELSVSSLQSRRFTFHLMKSSKYGLKLLVYSLADVNPSPQSATLPRELLCAGTAQCCKVTAVPGLSSPALLKPDVHSSIICYSEGLAISASLRNH